ncbi:MAG: hypothetical protein AVDCRST_MAG51-1603, partial [uncultured Ramlibacter sp.]
VHTTSRFRNAPAGLATSRGRCDRCRIAGDAHGPGSRGSARGRPAAFFQAASDRCRRDVGGLDRQRRIGRRRSREWRPGKSGEL